MCTLNAPQPGDRAPADLLAQVQAHAQLYPPELAAQLVAFVARLPEPWGWEALGLVRQLDQLQRVRPGRGVAHVEAETHSVRC